MDSLPKLFDLRGQVALVTGGGGLLGVEFSRTMFEAGADIVIADIDEKAAKALAASLNETQLGERVGSSETPQRAIGLETDVSSEESVQRMVVTALQEFDHLDILVNSAALDPKFDSQDVSIKGADEDQLRTINSLSLTFEDFPLDLWKQALDINLTGMFLSCQVVGKQMVAQGKGVIINVCSIYGLVGPDQRIYHEPDKPPRYKPAYYSVTKAGVLGLTKYLATYYAGKGIRVNALTPGGVFNDQDDSFVEAYSARSVLGRMADKKEMNGALLFLASDASTYMTGANLVVDGGWTAW